MEEEIAVDLAKQTAFPASEAAEITPGEIETMVDKISSCYGVSMDQRERAKSAEFLFLAPDAFSKEVSADLEKRGILTPTRIIESTKEFEAVAQALGTTIDELQQKQDDRHRELIEEILKFGGLCQMIDGRLKIMIKKEEGVSRKKLAGRTKHEILHALSTFDSDHSGLQSEWGTCHYLNEAASEVLRLHAEIQREVPEMLRGIQAGEMSVLGYKKDVERLLATMLATHKDGSPVTVSRLVEYYFNKQGEEDPGINAFLLRFEIGKKADSQFENQVKGLLDELYR